MKISKEIENHYQQLLGIDSPWEVKKIDLNIEEGKIDIQVVWPSGEKVTCPVCGDECGIYDYRSERTWRHLDTMQFATYLRCRVPRSDCKEHGAKSVKTPWSEPGHRFTLLFERFAIDVLLASKTIKGAKKLLGISWDEMHLIQKHAVRRGLESRKLKEIKYLGIDEKSFLKGHNYASILYDLHNTRILDVVQGRTIEATDTLLATLPEKKRKSVKAVAVDMWEPYKSSIEKYLPNADIVHDKFHIIGYLTKAVDSVRKQENKLLRKEGHDYLVGTKYFWLTNKKNWEEKHKQIYQSIRNMNLKTGRAWSIKETFSNFWDYIYLVSAKKFFQRWYYWAKHSRLKPIIKAAKTLKRHIVNILTYFKHRITNAAAEGFNSKIQNIKTNARGYRNFENYRIAILFFCGKLDLYPQKTL